MSRRLLPHLFGMSAGLLFAALGLAQPAQTQPAESKPTGLDKKDQPAPPPATAPAVQPTEEKKPEDKKDEPAEDPAYILGFTMKDINGNDVKLEQFKGRVVLFVNVASRCGYTPQYEGLQRLYEKRQEEGLVILGFPANNFNNQEPGTDAEIKEYCSSKYGVTFPMFSKISVTGDDQHPLYKKLAAQPAPVGGDPKWNFTKFLVDRNGKVVARFNTKAQPDETKDAESKAMADKIDELLKAK